MRGHFITFEGGEGTGKSTQARALAKALREKGIDVVETREPGGSPAAELIRRIILSGAVEPLGEEMETMLFFSARDDHLNTLIRPALCAGKWVICDRFADSTRAYQQHAGKVPGAVIRALERAVIGDTWPDLTFILDIDPKTGLERARGETGDQADRFEEADLAFHRKIRAAFRTIAKDEPERCVLIAGGQAAGQDRRIDPAGGLGAARHEPCLGRIETVARRGRTSEKKGAGDDERAWPHPREARALFGHAGLLESLVADWHGGHLHHGLLLCGPRGIGKATLAYALARALLAGADQASAGDPGSPLFRQVAAASHPDLLAIDGDDSTGATRAIGVDRIRQLISFFSLTASGGQGEGYRVGIVDRADDMNTSSANALLKLLEEPPQRAILILVCETPGRLPATILSRCRRVPVEPLNQSDLAACVAALGGTPPQAESPALHAWIGGSVARALQASDPAVARTITETLELASAYPRIDEARLTRFATGFGPREGREAFDIAFDVLMLHVCERAREAARESAPGGDSLAQLTSRLAELKREADVLNLDRPRTVLSAFRELGLALQTAP